MTGAKHRPNPRHFWSLRTRQRTFDHLVNILKLLRPRKNTERGCVCLEISKAELICREKPEETSTWDDDRGVWDRRRTLRCVRSLCRYDTTYQHDIIHRRLHRETQSIYFHSFSDSLGWQRHTFVELLSCRLQSGTSKSTTGILTLDPSHNN